MPDARRHALRFYMAVAVGVAIAVAAVVVRRPARGGPGAPPLPEVESDLARWCAEGLEPLPGDACFGEPARRDEQPPPVVVYLHGLHDPTTMGDELERQARVGRMARERGFAVLALRGKQGQCTAPERHLHWCWPSNPRNADDGPAFVRDWSAALRAAEDRVGRGRRVLLGFSNGGYFAALILARGLFPFDAIAIAHAGPVDRWPRTDARPPVLLVTADEDAALPEMLELDAALRRDGFPHAIVARPGGHALPAWDIDMALTFFRRVKTERLPFVPPLGPPPSPPKPPEADATATEPEASGTELEETATPPGDSASERHRPGGGRAEVPGGEEEGSESPDGAGRE